MYSKKLDKSNKVDDYFSKNLAFLRQSKKLSLVDLSREIGTGKSIIGNYEKGTAEPSASTLLKIVQYFGIAFEDLMKKDLEKGVHKKNAGSVHPSVHPTVHPKSKEVSFSDHIVDTSGMKLVPLTDIKAAAGQGYLNPETFNENEVMRLPISMVRGGTYLIIGIKGTSMAPTLQDGGKVLIRLLDRGDWATMLNERIYVIVDTDGKTYLKRVKNRLSGEKGFIVLSSDSPDKVSYPTFNIQADEIQFIWYVEWYFTAKMPNIHDQYYNRLSNLEDTVQEMQAQFLQMKKVLK